MTQALITQPPPSETGAILQVIERAARDPSIDIEKMRSLLQMHQEIRAKAAETAFMAAMQRAQGELGPVLRDAKNDHTHSRYARLETIIAAINPIITGHGFSMSFGTADSLAPGHYRVTCDVSHAEGHSRHYFADVPSDAVGAKGTVNKNPIHAFGSAITYGRRYLTTMIFNIAIANEDDDGNASYRNSGPPKRTMAEISANKQRRERECEAVKQDLLQIETLSALQAYEKEHLTPEFMASLGNAQWAVEEWLETRRKELSEPVDDERGPMFVDEPPPETTQERIEDKVDYIRDCHTAIDAFQIEKNLLEWWNSREEKTARRKHLLTKEEVQDLVARVMVRRDEILKGPPELVGPAASG